MDTKPRNSLTAKESISTDGLNAHSQKSAPDATAYTDDSRRADTESEPEEGEITDSECETYSEEELTSEETGDSEYSENEGELLWIIYGITVFFQEPVKKKQFGYFKKIH